MESPGLSDRFRGLDVKGSETAADRRLWTGIHPSLISVMTPFTIDEKPKEEELAAQQGEEHQDNTKSTTTATTKTTTTTTTTATMSTTTTTPNTSTHQRYLKQMRRYKKVKVMHKSMHRVRGMHARHSTGRLGQYMKNISRNNVMTSPVAAYAAAASATGAKTASAPSSPQQHSTSRRLSSQHLSMLQRRRQLQQLHRNQPLIGDESANQQELVQLMFQLDFDGSFDKYVNSRIIPPHILRTIRRRESQVRRMLRAQQEGGGSRRRRSSSSSSTSSSSSASSSASVSSADEEDSDCVHDQDGESTAMDVVDTASTTAEPTATTTNEPTKQRAVAQTTTTTQSLLGASPMLLAASKSGLLRSLRNVQGL
eukprot:TRINITY_DN66392_c9_g4_i1.p1 TRINITY_DN66392_c9_g4~~TRINITY_DN66392_c9_g4_i1.p1  ORF type:complete len:368 (-),score=136.65 TRINITY_DN66392_c9_g4_i1:111-1214(-)